MKKLVYILVALFATNQALQGQGTLPMFWDMDGTDVPTGFSADQGPATSKTTYSLSKLVHSSPYALRLDYTTEYLQAHWSGKADSITFWIAGTMGSGATSWEGQVTVDESVDGTTWKTLKSFNDDIPSNTTQYLVRVSSEARYFRIYYKQKVSGFNLAIDDVSIRPKGATENPEIKLYYGSELMSSEGSVKTGNDTLIKFRVFNNSTKNALNISDISLSGNQASEFKVLTQTPVSIEFQQSKDIEIELINKNNGTYAATMSIASNDPDLSKYVLDFSTIRGSKASEPTAQPKDLQVDAKAFRLSAAFSNAGAEGYLVLVSNGGATDVPVDGVTYERGEYIGSSRVLHSGAVNGAVDIDNIVANTSYQVRVFAFNGFGEYTNYLVTSPATSNVTTPGLDPADYYSSIDTSSTDFVKDLYTLINPHTRIYYSNYSSFVVNNFEQRDTTDGKAVVDGFYSGYKYIYEPPFGHSVMSREHCYPQSYMTKVSDNEPNYSDLHFLFTVHQSKVNAVRSNYPLGEVDPNSISSTFEGGIFGKNSDGTFVYEPRDFAKGIAARANFYACAAYHTADFPFTLPTSNQFINELQFQEILKKWNKQYPPNNWEIARHEYIAQTSVQGNRNPFIDNPSWACKIDFAMMKYDANACAQGQNNIKPTEEVIVKVFPNPTVDNIQVDLSGFNGREVEIYVVDFFERTIYQGHTNSNSANISSKNWKAGNYLLLIRSADGATSAQTIVKP